MVENIVVANNISCLIIGLHPTKSSRNWKQSQWLVRNLILYFKSVYARHNLIYLKLPMDRCGDSAVWLLL